MNILTAVGVGIIATVLSIILKQYKPEYSLLISIASGIIILLAMITAVKPITETITQLVGAAGLNNTYGQVLIKSLGICYVTQLASDSCKDAGESAVGSKLELAGKITIIVIALPMFNELVSIVTGLISVN